jgi:C-terminal processing protease CtpA/Prc
MKPIRHPVRVAFVALVFALALPGQEVSPAPLSAENDSLFRDVFSMILKEYVDPKLPDDVVAGALAGAAETAGPESAYVPPNEVAAYRELQVPSAVLPLYVTKGQDFAKVLACFPGTDPSIKAGDALRFINGKSTFDMTYPQVLEALRGPAGEEAKCVFLKPETWQSYAVVLKRKPYPKAAISEIPGGGAAIAVPSLDVPPPDDLASRLQSIKGSCVVDLRGCASENAPVALEWAGLLGGDSEGIFLLDQQGKHANPVSGKGLLKGRQFKVLVDGATARAGELLAAALVKAGGVLSGEPTFGWAPKFCDFSLSNGGLLRLLCGHYTDDSGEAIRQKPLKPSIEARVREGESPAAFYARLLAASAPSAPPSTLPETAKAANGN